MNKYLERLYNGIIKENPTFVLMLGMCPTLAVTSSAINGIGMGYLQQWYWFVQTCLFHCLEKLFQMASECRHS